MLMLSLGFKFKINVRVDLRLMLGFKLKDNVTVRFKGWG